MFKDAVYAQFARIGKALSSPRRLELLDLLSQSPKTVETLSRETGMSVANVSQHLQTLLEARLVRFQKKGNYAIYRLSDPKINRLLLLMQELGEDLLAEVKQLRDEFLANHDALEPIRIDELKSRLQNEDLVLIDVRPREEYEFAHIPGALSIPVKELEQHLSRLPRDKKIVAYCRGRYCVYAAEAVQRFRSHGIEAIRLEDGVREWKELQTTS
ncbi:metalloregulator ArsR/SmtB family transcription factor [Polycladomyces sp. WAk]|uniref:Metalloregulator ArsR/SmtB family transcription factor n=1 Tax=Polycladomyces zharkentensis TaxID=2807616 RepID=A0ABS2WJV5_9BACL|nr:metalloregulator ArsR/SmtB family transcription factor [Polycladomyces sp. WAk]MBN2909585.1 metalloregulator ArsR/SmtB family transcription factor [Polycladomyces sp. WAk]